MIKTLDNLGSFLLGLFLLVAFLPITLAASTKALDADAYGFGLQEDKSQRASAAKMRDVDEYKHFTELQYIMLAAVDNGFSNNQQDGSYYQYVRRIFIDKGGVSPVQYWCQYDIQSALLDRISIVLGVASTANISPIDDASNIRAYDLYINRQGDTFFKRR